MVIEETKRLMTKISSYPSWVRYPLWICLTFALIQNHWYLSHIRFPKCPKTECPPLSIFDNCNKWRYPEKAQMERLQQGHRELFGVSLILLVPDWAKKLIKMYEQLRQNFATMQEIKAKYAYKPKTKDEIKKSEILLYKESSV